MEGLGVVVIEDTKGNNVSTTKTVTVVQSIRVTVDERKFTPEFMREFRDSFYDFDTLNEHIMHLGQLCARGIVDDFSFIEGYGRANLMGIKFVAEGGHQEIDA